MVINRTGCKSVNRGCACDRRPPSPLDSIHADHWLPEHTNDLIDLLHVLGRLIALEPAQADLLNRICQGPLRCAGRTPGRQCVRAAGSDRHVDGQGKKQEIVDLRGLRGKVRRADAGPDNFGHDSGDST
jgi:hypothetical protein